MAKPCPLPAHALLARYAQRGDGTYTDCFEVKAPGAVTLAAFVEAFYSSRMFWLERFMIGLLFARRAGDADARRLGLGESDVFSAWKVEGRAESQLLMHEILSHKTRSWFGAEPLPGGATRLLFGSAVLPVGRKADGMPKMSLLFALVGFHKIYARLLLDSAAARLERAG